ncbi:MAG: IS200/IS605 family transposase [Candidatus Kapabacteria bacterium]|nr:IS200/IS605 family transposase [Candidatus Kapabacteria bacterium]
MSTYTQIIYQIVFSTKNRERTLTKPNREELLKYIWGILKSKNCHLYRISAVEDHLHLITHLHPTISLASLVKDIKLASSTLIKQKGLFPNFGGWAEGYGAFTYSIREKDRLILYVKNQEEHHRTKSFREEFIEMLQEHEIEFDEKYLV